MDVNMSGEQTVLSGLTHAFSGKELRYYPQLVTYLLLVKRACAWANYQIGILSFSEYEQIEDVCNSISSQSHLFCADVMQGGGGVAVHMNINEVISHQLGGPSWLTKVSASQSTTDVNSTALNLTLAQEISHCKDICMELVEVLRQLAGDHMSIRTRGRTCLRDAGFLSYGERFAGFSSLFNRHYQSLDSFSDFARCNLGATALGTGEGIDPLYRQTYSGIALEKLIELSGVNIKLHTNFIDSVQNRDDLFDLASCLESFVISLLKMAKDIRLLASGPQSGFNEIQLPPVIKGSSFYQNKINPTLEETVIQMCFMVCGLIKSAKLGIEHSELDMNIYYLHSGICLLDGFILLKNLIPKYILYNLSQLTIINKQ